jgi:hypothetical protein
MSEQRHPIEDELKARLSAVPSLELQARIRANTPEAIPKTIGWFPLGVGVAAALALVIAVVILNPETEKPAPTQVVSLPPVIAPVEPIVIVPEPPEPTVPGKKAPAPRILVRVESTPPSASLELARIELPPLRPIDLAGALTPIPQPVVPIASVEPMKLEPFALAARTEGVNE